MGIDAESLAERYRREREKRLREDGTTQYRHASDGLSNFLADPFAGPAPQRAPLTEDVEVLVVGAGFGGLLVAARLRQAGIKDIRIIDKASDFGGTWYWNRFPGAACDVEAYIYMPFAEELGNLPSERYAPGREIRAHARAMARHFDLYRGALWQTGVSEMRWDEQAKRWAVNTDRGDLLSARFVCLAIGPFSQLKLPGIPGIEAFRGHSFHTSRWDYAYTGGDETGNLTGLADKKVAIIGTGATAVQCVPPLGQSARHLYVFQRTPSAVEARNNSRTDPAWIATLQPGWQRQRIENFNAVLMGQPVEDLIKDGWTGAFRPITVEGVQDQAEAARLRQLLDFQKMELVRARVDAIVKDPKTAEALKPYYNRMCKRPCFNDGYLETFNLSNVTLVDTDGRGVELITENGIVAAGNHYEVDCIIYATGFEWMTTEYTERTGFHIYGRGGRSLADAWRDGTSSLHGIYTRGFPNCFIMGNSQAAATSNYTHILDELARHVSFTIRHCSANGVRAIEPSLDAQAAWSDLIVSLAKYLRPLVETCTPGYYNNEGTVSLKNARNSVYVGSSIDYMNILREHQQTGNFDGLELTYD